MKKLNYIILILLAVGFTQCSKTSQDRLVDSTLPAEKNVKVIADATQAWRSSTPPAGPARDIKLGDYSSFTLDNELTVIMVENHKLPVVSYQLRLKNDPILEGEQAGFVSIAGDLMATGTTTKTKAEIDEAIDFIGADLNTSSTGMYASSLKKHGGKLLDLMTDILYNPSFSQDEFEKLKKQNISGIESNKTDPNFMASNVAAAVNYGAKHPYGEIVSIGSIDKVSIGKCKEYYDTYFRPNNAYLIIVGDLSEAEARTQAEQYFGSWEKGSIPTSKYTKPTSISATNVAFANKDGAVQSVIKVTYPVDLEPASAELVQARVMNNILGGGIFSGRLMQNLREDKAYTYGARSQLSPDQLVGSFSAGASVRNEVTDSSVQEILFEMDRLVKEPISEKDLALVKSSMTGSFGRSLESPQTIAGFALNTFKYKLPKDYYETYLKRLEAVTVADVQAMAVKYIRPEKANIVVVGSKDDVAEKLVRFDHDGELTFYDAFGNIVEVNEGVIPDGVTGKSVVADYLEAIGGTAKLSAIKTLEKKASMEIMGQTAESIEQFKAPNKYYTKIAIGTMVLQESVYDGAKALMGQMGQNQVVTEGPMLEQTAKSSVMFEESEYMTDAYALEVKGIEDIDGEKVYKVAVSQDGAAASYSYFSIASGLLVRKMSMVDGPDGNSMTTTSDFSDYRDVDGVKIAYQVVLTGLMPTPLVMKISDVKIDAPIEDERFMIK